VCEQKGETKSEVKKTHFIIETFPTNRRIRHKATMGAVSSQRGAIKCLNPIRLALVEQLKRREVLLVEKEGM